MIATIALALRMSMPSFDGKRRDHGEREIGQGQTPQSEPIVRDLMVSVTPIEQRDEHAHVEQRDRRQYSSSWSRLTSALGRDGLRLAHAFDSRRGHS